MSTYIAYLSSDQHLAGPTSNCIVRPADQQEHSKNQQSLKIYYGWYGLPLGTSPTIVATIDPQGKIQKVIMRGVRQAFLR